MSRSGYFAVIPCRAAMVAKMLRGLDLAVLRQMRKHVEQPLDLLRILLLRGQDVVDLFLPIRDQRRGRGCRNLWHRDCRRLELRWPDLAGFDAGRRNRLRLVRSARRGRVGCRLRFAGGGQFAGLAAEPAQLPPAEQHKERHRQHDEDAGSNAHISMIQFCCLLTRVYVSLIERRKSTSA